MSEETRAANDSRSVNMCDRAKANQGQFFTHVLASSAGQRIQLISNENAFNSGVVQDVLWPEDAGILDLCSGYRYVENEHDHGEIARSA